MINLGVKLFADISDLQKGIKTAITENQKLSGETGKTYAQLKREWLSARTALQNLGAQVGFTSKAYKDAAVKVDALGKQIGINSNLAKSSTGIFSKLSSSIGGMAAGFMGVTAITGGVVSFFKSAIEGAMEDEVAARKLTFALNNNTYAAQRLIAFKDQLMQSTLFSEEEIMSAINMGVELGRTEKQTKVMVETALGLSRVTGQDLQTAMQQLSGTYEGTLGKLAKFDGSLKELTATQLANGEAIDILHGKLARFATEGLDTTAGKAAQLKKNWDELKDTLGSNFLPIINSLITGINGVISGQGFTNAIIAEQAVQYGKDSTAGKDKVATDAMMNESVKNLAASNQKFKTALDALMKSEDYLNASYDEQIKLRFGLISTYDVHATKIKKESDSVKDLGKAWITTTESFKKYTDAGGFGIPAGPTSTAPQGDITPMTPRGPGLVTTGAEIPTQIGTGGNMTGLLKDMGTFDEKMAQLSVKLTAFLNKWGAVIQAVQQAISQIGNIIDQGYQNRIATLDAYYTAEKEKIENSTMPEKQKNKELDKLNKEQEKKRKELMVKQAKDQKAVSIIQAIIATALAIVQALANPGGVAGIVVAALVGAMGIAQIALIASQPVPALAGGGLAFGPTMAMVGDNPNAGVNPEVIAPLSALSGLLQPQVVVLTTTMYGNDLLLSHERTIREQGRIHP